MYKWYCDLCGIEIPSQDAGQLVVHNDAQVAENPKLPSVRLEVMKTVNGVINKGDICRRCLFDLLLTARPAPLECRHE